LEGPLRDDIVGTISRTTYIKGTRVSLVLMEGENYYELYVNAGLKANLKSDNKSEIDTFAARCRKILSRIA
jgi:hypothetical protein